MALEQPLYEESKKILFRDIYKNLNLFLYPAYSDGTNTASNNTPVTQLADAATKLAYFSCIIPSDLRLLSMKFIWSTPAASGNLRWQVDIGEGGESDANNARTTGGTAVTTATITTADDINFTEILDQGAISISKLNSGNLWGIKFSRLGAAAEDTLGQVVNLYGIIMTFK